MRENYGTGMSKEDIKNLNITQAQLWSKFTDPRIGLASRCEEEVSLHRLV